MKVELDIVERIQLLSLLPPEGNLVTMRVLSELGKELGFSEKELTDWSVEVDTKTDRISWDADAVQVKSVSIGATALSILKEAVKKLDSKDKITGAMLPVIEKLKL